MIDTCETVSSRAMHYAGILSVLIQAETAGTGRTDFYRFQEVLRALFPPVTATCK